MDAEPEADVFPVRLRDTRRQRGLDQSELSTASGLPGTSISLFESAKRKPSLDNLRKLADALDVSVDYLLGRTNNSSSHLETSVLEERDRGLAEELDRVAHTLAKVRGRLSPGGRK